MTKYTVAGEEQSHMYYVEEQVEADTPEKALEIAALRFKRKYFCISDITVREGWLGEPLLTYRWYELHEKLVETPIHSLDGT